MPFLFVLRQSRKLLTAIDSARGKQKKYILTTRPTPKVIDVMSSFGLVDTLEWRDGLAFIFVESFVDDGAVCDLDFW